MTIRSCCSIFYDSSYHFPCTFSSTYVRFHFENLTIFVKTLEVAPHFYYNETNASKTKEGAYLSKATYRTIAVFVADINEEYNDSFLQSLNKCAFEYNFKILYFYSFSAQYFHEAHDDGEKNIFQLVNYDKIDGVVILAQAIKSREIAQDIADHAIQKGKPVVSIDRFLDGCININFNYDDALITIIKHMIEKHHLHCFNFVAGVRGNEYSERRLEIFRKVMAEYHIPVEEERIGYGDFWGVPTEKVMDDFLTSDLPFPEAIICANDLMAITVANRLVDAGYRVPEDVAVTGIDGLREARQHTPSITTAKYDIDAAVRNAYDALADVFDGNTPNDDIWINAQIIYGGSCGCVAESKHFPNLLMRDLFEDIERTKLFNQKQIRMIEDLSDKNSFPEVFESVKTYAAEFCTQGFWLCIVDDFLTEEEFSDILEDTTLKRTGYSSRMDLMLCNQNGEWQGLIDFETKDLLPQLENILETASNIFFVPLHNHEHTIGYAAIASDRTIPNFRHCYQFFMNVSTVLEITKSHLRQHTIIQNLENKYVHDPLTGLLNRRGFYQKMQKIFTICVEQNKYLMIVSADLNGLKPINDTYGHADGDIAISTVAKALSVAASNDEVCARFGGDEFVVAGQVDSKEEGQEYIQRVHAYLNSFNATSKKPYEVSTSLGVVTEIPNESMTLDQFINQADELMYSEKAKHHLSRGR